MKFLKSSLILSAAHLKVAFLKPCIEPATFPWVTNMSIVGDKRMDDSLACKSMVCNDH